MTFRSFFTKPLFQHFPLRLGAKRTNAEHSTAIAGIEKPSVAPALEDLQKKIHQSNYSIITTGDQNRQSGNGNGG